MAEKTQFMSLTEEVIKEAIDIINELIKEEVFPLIEYRKKLEKEIADKAIAEMYKLEQEVTTKIEKEEVYKYLNR